MHSTNSFRALEHTASIQKARRFMTVRLCYNRSSAHPSLNMAAVHDGGLSGEDAKPVALLVPSSTHGGRAVVAATDLPEGTVIMRSSPAAYCVHDHLRSSRCACCLTKTADLQRCKTCKDVWYCSKECQIRDWKAGHKTECHYMASLGSGPAKTDGAEIANTTPEYCKPLTDTFKLTCSYFVEEMFSYVDKALQEP